MDEQAKVIARMREELAARERERAAREAEGRLAVELEEQVQRAQRILEMRDVCEKVLGREVLEALGIEILSGGVKFVYRGRETMWQIHKLHVGDPEYRKTVEAAIVKFCDETDELRAKADALIAGFQAVQTLAEYRAFDDEVPWNLQDYVAEAARIAWERVEEAEAEREAQRVALEEEAFYPFVYYRVYNAMVANSDDGEHFIDYHVLDSLTGHCVPGGWWVSAHCYDLQRPTELKNVYKVERVEVCTVEELPAWCPKQETAFGQIRIPPAGAERL